ncbi:hypothetical protein NOCARDAX2BIS_520123 [Nocardioides sp. AX2bis]|nr:hypothetical protein NOCARDAX2BIS_520123 [Nocardioides sp. AX2bis]
MNMRLLPALADARRYTRCVAHDTHVDAQNFDFGHVHPRGVRPRNRHSGEAGRRTEARHD